jgi:uncharacterized protein (TIGR02271 family)
MTSPATIRVTGPGGLRGTIDPTLWPLDGSRAEVLVRLEGRAPVVVPLEALVRQDDGSYRLTLDLEAFERRTVGSSVSESALVLPVIQEALDVGTRQVETGRVRIRKVVHEWEEIVDPPLWREDVVLERIPVNRVIEAPVSVRTEGDTLIIPLLEEVLVVEKRLLLKEELHLTKRRVETHTPQRVTLRREEPIVERVNREGSQGNPRAEESHDG